MLKVTDRWNPTVTGQVRTGTGLGRLTVEVCKLQEFLSRLQRNLKREREKEREKKKKVSEGLRLECSSK